MIIDCRSEAWRKSTAFGTLVFLDGVEVKRVWYVDTDLVVVKTYDVAKDDMTHTHHDKPTLKLRDDAVLHEVVSDCILSATLIGDLVTLRPPDSQ